MALFPLRFPPGVLANGTKYQAKGRWYSAQLVRFSQGAIRPVGGWQAVPVTGTAAGAPRSLLAWRRTGDSGPMLAVGTNSHIYSFTSGTLTDRTPADLSAGGADTVFGLGGFGAGAFGAGPFGTGDRSQTTEVEAAIWHLDTFGDKLMGVLAPSDGRLFSWDGITDTLELVSGAPTSNRGVVVTPERFVFVLGAAGDPRKVQWSSQESLTEWTASETTTAGDFILPGSGRIVRGIRGRGETLIWTNEALFACQYVGGTLVYSFGQLGSGCGLVAPQAAVVMDGKAAWMGQNCFYVYDGYVRPAPSAVSDYVFSNFNSAMRVKCWAETRADYSEAWFHFPSGSATEPDRYVIWNYLEDHWTMGECARTAGIDRGAFDYPICVTSDGVLWEHEHGSDHTGEVLPYLESGPLEIGDGERVMMVRQLVPDEATRAGQGLGSLHAHLYSAIYPTATETQNGPYTLANPTPVRITSRQVRLRLDETVPGDWRIGVLRIDAVPRGLR